MITKRDTKLPSRKKTSRKGDNGRVLIIGGSKDYVGAAALAGIAALRSGVDWVTIAAPTKVAWAINGLSPDLVTKKLSGNYITLRHLQPLLELSKQFTVVLIGNGLGEKSIFFANRFIKSCPVPTVIDADGIKATSIFHTTESILTPHATEFEHLLRNSKLTKTTFRKHLQENVIVLKGPRDKIITRTKMYVNETGNAGMTKAGTGDVLAGLCAGYYAQLGDPLQAAINATYYAGLAGDKLYKTKGYTYLASDLAEELKRLA